MKNINTIIEELLGNELDNAELYSSDNYVEAWWPDGQGVAYKVTAVEKDGAWISAKLLEEEGGTIWDWADSMFYPYKG